MNENMKYIGRTKQTGIYIGKLFRMFVFQSDWKVIPMAAVIAAIVCSVIGAAMNKTMEGTLRGAFALSCICIWNGMFNSIQSVCRERAIIKREHRSGMHISSYVAAHMVYQAFICIGQSIVILVVMNISKVKLAETSFITGSSTIDMAITFFLITYAADMMALLVSSVVKNPTTAMTLVPFLLIFQLIFSGSFFSFGEKSMANKASNFTISKWGIVSMCSVGYYNDLPMTSLWSAFEKMKDLKIEHSTLEKLDADKEIVAVLSQLEGYKMGDILDELKKNGADEIIKQKCGENAQKAEYESNSMVIEDSWSNLILFTLLFAGLSVVSLKFVDKDKR